MQANGPLWSDNRALAYKISFRVAEESHRKKAGYDVYVCFDTHRKEVKILPCVVIRNIQNLKRIF